MGNGGAGAAGHKQPASCMLRAGSSQSWPGLHCMIVLSLKAGQQRVCGSRDLHGAVQADQGCCELSLSACMQQALTVHLAISTFDLVAPAAGARVVNVGVSSCSVHLLQGCVAECRRWQVHHVEQN